MGLLPEPESLGEDLGDEAEEAEDMAEDRRGEGVRELRDDDGREPSARRMSMTSAARLI